MISLPNCAVLKLTTLLEGKPLPSAGETGVALNPGELGVLLRAPLTWFIELIVLVKSEVVDIYLPSIFRHGWTTIRIIYGILAYLLFSIYENVDSKIRLFL